MYDEALAAPDCVAAQLADDDTARTLAERAARLNPTTVFTVARGSSDHAAAYFATLLMTQLGVPALSLPMSTANLHAARLRVEGQLAVAFSQSGRSPDLIDAMRALDRLGATTLACVNADHSPLAQAVSWNLPVLAGEERSVAATKSYIGMLTRAVQLVGHWQQCVTDRSSLLEGLATLPDAMREAASLDWSEAVEAYAGVSRMMVVGRGAGLAIALEAALKLKETSGIQAEAFSSAEVRHGPMELIDAGYPLLVFAPRGPEQSGLIAFADAMRARGARVLLAAPASVRAAALPLVETAHAMLDPVAAIQSFYLMAERLASARGRNPDAPMHLSKVTRTH
ncbi:SIS domain-containing protein [Pararobbsia silviterrae]|uniref:SIS domain-containing protein n=1 Tax=Pararobbsia silviterrae TaxID=1792498 RepID=A0A494XW73_9BURK|nr:SIS domain-containing protein [Pararobbsia silviterrae]RKP51843.1 SIS domain-containing protein [Pararobbsia silviterrae]